MQQSLALGDIAVNFQNGSRLPSFVTQQDLAAFDNDFVALAGGVAQQTLPGAFVVQRLIDGLWGGGEAGLKQSMGETASRLFFSPPIQRLRALIPDDDTAVDIANDDGV